MKRVTKILIFIMAVGLVAGCAGNEKSKGLVINNVLTEAEKAAGIFTPEVMWKMGRIGSHAVSPDGKQLVYTTTYYSIEENRGVTSLFVMPVEGGDPVRITDHAGNDSDPSWNKAGDRIYFMSDRGGDSQIWSIAPDGTGMKQFSKIDGGIEAFGIAPSGDRLFYIQPVKVGKIKSSDVFPDMPQSRALIYDDLMARHWNYWDEGEYRHIFIAQITDAGISEGLDIMQGEAWDAPMAPYFDAAEITWNNAGTQLAYTCKKMTGTEYAVSTDSDIYLYDIASGKTANINKSITPNDHVTRAARFPGYDKYPVFSPDDSMIAFISMPRAGNEADKERLVVYTINDGSFIDLSQNFDSQAANAVWTDNSTIHFIAPLKGTHQICSVHVSDNPQVTVLTSGDHDIGALSMAGGSSVVSMTTLSQAAELYRVDGGYLTQITFENRHIYDNIKMGEVQKRWIRSTDGTEVLTWVTLPPDFDPSKKYPALLYCQGGPQSTLEWSFRWNYQLMAAQGYIVVAPARKGVPGFGQAWTDQISGDYSGQNIRDLLSAIDEVAREPWVDADRLGCVGASYGGYTAFYLAGTHNKRFKAFISHCGIFNFESMYGHTEELFFINNDYGGPYWEKDNKIIQRSYANSPHRFVAEWDTPILIITGLNDFRIPYTQSLEALTAARVRGVPAKLVAFENEAHQVFKPQNNIVWNREFFGWLDTYLK